MKYKTIALFTAFVVGIGIQNADAQSYSFQIEAEIAEHKRGNLKKPETETIETEQKNLWVTLSEGKISVRDGNSEKIYDFDREKVFYISHDAEATNITSLYAIPAFKEAEKKNRLVLAMAAAKSGILDSRSTLFEIEMLFGGKVQEKVVKDIAEKKEGEEQVFYYKDDRAASYSLSMYKLPESLRDEYKKYLIYEHSIHPVIVESLSRAPSVFQTLNYRNKQELPYLKVSQFVLKDFKRPETDPVTIPQSYDISHSGIPELAEVIERSKQEQARTVHDYAKEMDALYNEGMYAEAFLLFHIYTNHLGVQDIDVLKPVVGKILNESPNNKDFMRLNQVITQEYKTKEDLGKAISYLSFVEANTQKYGYILKVYMANFIDFAGDTIEARRLIYEALGENPHLTGAYKDLGDKYYKSYNTWASWACWDHMRQINKDHMLVPQIEGFEAYLKQTYPDYF